MEKGACSENKGKTLNEIDIQLEEWGSQEERASSNNEKEVTEETDEEVGDVEGNIEEVGMCFFLCFNISFLTEFNYRYTSRTKKDQNTNKIRGTWTEKQKSVILNHFKKHIKTKQAPKKHECMELMKRQPKLFTEKNWVQVKVLVYNSYRTK